MVRVSLLQQARKKIEVHKDDSDYEYCLLSAERVRVCAILLREAHSLGDFWPALGAAP